MFHGTRKEHWVGSEQLHWVLLGGWLCTSHLSYLARGGSVLSINGQLAASCRLALSLIPVRAKPISFTQGRLQPAVIKAHLLKSHPEQVCTASHPTESARCSSCSQFTSHTCCWMLSKLWTPMVHPLSLTPALKVWLLSLKVKESPLGPSPSSLPWASAALVIEPS